MKSPVAAIRRLLSFEMTAKQYLLYQAVGSVLVNAALNAGFAWLKHGDPLVPLWTSSGIAFDTLTTTFLLSALTVVFGTVTIRTDLKLGRVRLTAWTPRSHPALKLFSHSVWRRALAFGPLFTVLAVPPTLGVFVLARLDALAFWPFFAFKVLYAVSLGMAVTPLNALWVLSRPADEPTAAA